MKTIKRILRIFLVLLIGVVIGYFFFTGSRV